MEELAPVDYDRWHIPVKTWFEFDDFINAQELDDALHVISDSSGVPLEVLIDGVAGESTSTAIPVFFTGAVDDRTNKTGPFFSGLSLAKASKFGVVAISDPTLRLSQELGLAWYAGNRHQDVQKRIGDVLRKIAASTGRQLLLVGGSGGGFAAMYFGSILGESCSVLAWNPQTDIFRYSPVATKSYFREAFGDTVVASLNAPRWEAATKEVLSDSGSTFSLLDVDASKLPRRMIILQNASDWHVALHLAPYLEAKEFKHRGRGVHEIDGERLAVIRDYGVDHAPMPTPAVLAAITALRDVDVDARSALDSIDAVLPSRGSPVSALPRDLRHLKSRIAENYHLAVSGVEGGVTVSVEIGLVPPGYGGITFTFFYVKNDGTSVFSDPRHEPAIDFLKPSSDMHEVGVVVRDGFQNEILVLRVGV